MVRWVAVKQAALERERFIKDANTRTRIGHGRNMRHLEQLIKVEDVENQINSTLVDGYGVRRRKPIFQAALQSAKMVTIWSSILYIVLASS